MPSVLDIINGIGFGTPGWNPSSGGTSSSTTSSGGSNLYDLLGLGLGAGTSILTAILGNKASGKQADAVSGAMDRATAASLAQAAQNRADVKPWLDAGKLSLGELLYRMGLAPRGAANTSTAQVPSNPSSARMPSGSPYYPSRLPGSATSINMYGGRFDPSNLDSLSTVDNSAIFDHSGDYPYVKPPYLAENNGPIRDIAGRPGENFWNTGGKPVLNGDTGQPEGDGQFGSLVAPFQFTADDPSFQWRLGNGLKAIERSAAARGTTFSGATLKSLDRYAGGEASQEYTNEFNRDQAEKTGIFNRYGTIAGYGPQVAPQVAASNTSLVNSGNALDLAGSTNLGAARASGYVTDANAITSISDMIRKYLQGRG